MMQEFLHLGESAGHLNAPKIEFWGCIMALQDGGKQEGEVIKLLLLH